MKPSLIAFGFQDPDSSIWIIVGVVLVLLFLVVVVAVAGLVIFFVMRKRSKAKAAAAAGLPAGTEAALSSPAPSYSPEPAYSPEVAAASSEVAASFDDLPPTLDPLPVEEMRSDAVEAAQPPAVDSGSLDFDPSRTVAITRENTVTISYGFIKFVSGVLSGQQFDVNPEGSFIGRESSLSQIVVPDPRISKRHLWIGVRDGLVRIVDQDSRNGTFVNDPKSDRITESTLTSGDTVILGESDVARFEYHA
jgi:hypothetical protein